LEDWQALGGTPQATTSMKSHIFIHGEQQYAFPQANQRLEGTRPDFPAITDHF
jgi:hypothetical protein